MRNNIPNEQKAAVNLSA